MSCLEAGHILSNGRKITIFCFSSAAMSVKSEIPAKIEFSQFFEDNTCAQLATAICSKFQSPVFSTNVYLVLMANFNPYQFTNSHYSPDYSQYGDGLFSSFSMNHDCRGRGFSTSVDVGLKRQEPTFAVGECFTMRTNQ